MLNYRFAFLLLLMMPAMVWADAGTRPSTRPDGVFLDYASGKPIADKLTPGFHKMRYQWVEHGQKEELTCSIYLPTGYDATNGRRWPMLTFMAGLGDRGDDPGLSMSVGVPVAIGRDPELQKWLPMIVLTPQCPGPMVWDSPGLSTMVVRLVHGVMDEFPVERSQVYVTGFSDGGKGSWIEATEEPGLFAVTAPVVSREWYAEQTAKLFAGTGITCLVISGLADDRSEPASKHMVQALRQQKVDVVYAPIPNATHCIWQAFFARKEFYEWLLLHHRGQAPPKDRPDTDYFLKMYTDYGQAKFDRQNTDIEIQKDLDRLEPYWFIDNCGDSGTIGLRNRMGHGMVLVTVPVSKEIPCRLQTTRELPKDKITELNLEVGRSPRSQWELVVRINEQEKLRTMVNQQTTTDNWLSVKVNLADYAGTETRIQLIQNAGAEGLNTAYWSKIKLVEKAGK